MIGLCFIPFFWYKIAICSWQIHLFSLLICILLFLLKIFCDTWSLLFIYAYVVFKFLKHHCDLSTLFLILFSLFSFAFLIVHKNVLYHGLAMKICSLWHSRTRSINWNEIFFFSSVEVSHENNFYSFTWLVFEWMILNTLIAYSIRHSKCIIFYLVTCTKKWDGLTYFRNWDLNHFRIIKNGEDL